MCEAEKKKESSCKGGAFYCVNLALRIVVLGLAVAAAALMATASQCTIFLYYGGPLHTITYKDFGPFVYLVVASSIGAFMEAIAIFLSICKIKKDGKPAKVLLPLIDAAVPALLYTATAAAFAAGNMSYCAVNGHRVGVCTTAAAGNFCNQVHIAMYVSLAAGVALLFAEIVKNWPAGDKKDCGSDGCLSDSDSDKSTPCRHGCHSKH
uniref:CASP-like protein n=1 Tax=Leersia perrieri TaxID=77586 RepID=A0A0D9XUT5_9ORYZ